MFSRSPSKGRRLEIVDRLYHRQMYIDLVSAYLRDSGSQVELARALGISEGAISQLLTPVYLPELEQHPRSPAQPPRAPGQRSHRTSRRHRKTYWADLVLDPPAGDLASTLSPFKTPSQERAEQIASELRTDGERRERLLYHMAMARRTARSTAEDDEPAYADPDEVVDRVRHLGREHESAMYTGEPVQARAGYAHVRDVSSQFLGHIDPVRQPLERVQVLLFLQDAASVLNYPDLALAYSRQAILLLATDAARKHPMRDRFLTNAMLAEVVALNNLELARDADDLAERALSDARYQEEPEAWRRSFLEQRLKSLSRLSGDHLYEAESTAADALELAPSTHGAAAGINAYLVQMYLRGGSSSGPLRLRKAGQLIDSLCAAAMSTSTSTLRRMRLLRAIAAYADARHDEDLLADALRQAWELSESAGLLHQRAALMRLPAVRRRGFRAH